MAVKETDIFAKIENMLSTDIPDGLAVSDAAGKEIHFLNPVAGSVYLLCDSAHDVRSIANVVKEEYSLPEAPITDVIACLTDLQSLGIVRKCE